MEIRTNGGLVLAASLAPAFIKLVGGVTATKTLGTATGFVTTSEKGDPFLITNRHVVRGRRQESDIDPESNRPLDEVDEILPHTLEIALNTPHLVNRYEMHVSLGDPEEIQESYGEPGERWNWLEHPTLGEAVDVVAVPLPIEILEFAIPFTVNPWPPVAALWPTTELHVVGYPLGQRASGDLAIWTRASIASEPELSYQGLPALLVDARTREGQSGSPVVHYRSPDNLYMNRHNSISIGSSHHLELIGVYSGRIHKDSDVGIVWHSSVVAEIVSQASNGK